MKKIIGIVIASMVFANIGFADIKMSEYKAFKDSLYEADGLVIQVFCVDGYKFVSTERSIFTTKGITNGISTVQFYDQAVKHGNPQPAKCKWK